MGIFDLGVNFDYQWLDNPSAGQDSSAFGVALYLIPEFGNFQLPLRAEYFNEGNSGIYTGASLPAGDGFTLTVTPTFKPSPKTFVRGEVAYISTKEPVFASGTKSDRTILGLEVGLSF
jgi:hypothetical protein